MAWGDPEQKRRGDVMKRAVKITLATAAFATVCAAGTPAAHADVVAAYLEGHGGLSSIEGDARAPSGNTQALAPGLGFQVGARVLLFEGYYDMTSFGDGAAVSRGILGLRGGFGLGSVRLVLRGGGGALFEQGGALTGHSSGVADRQGVVARAGISLEKRLAPQLFLAGVGLDGEVFSLENAAGSGAGTSGRTTGADLFASLRILFELGI
jgi:hypothetical protein